MSRCRLRTPAKSLDGLGPHGNLFHQSVLNGLVGRISFPSCPKPQAVLSYIPDSTIISLGLLQDQLVAPRISAQLLLGALDLSHPYKHMKQGGIPRRPP